MRPDALLRQAVLSLHTPRQGLRGVLALGLRADAGLLALLLMAVASALMLQLTLLALPSDQRLFAQALFGTPLVTAAVQFAVLLLTAGLVQGLGRWAGGRGSLAEVLVTVAWLQFITLMVQAVQMAAGFVLPALALVLGWAGVALFFWLLTAFVAEVHGFSSHLKVFGAIFAVMTLLALLLSLILSALLGPETLAHV